MLNINEIPKVESKTIVWSKIVAVEKFIFPIIVPSGIPSKRTGKDREKYRKLN